jgi:hypothetical protein
MMMRLVLSILLLSGFIGCTDASDENPDWKWEDQETEQPEVETKDVWADVTSEYSGLKEGIRIMKATELMDKPAVAYVAIADMSKVDFGVWGINDPKLEGTDESFKKPSAINSQVDAQVVINGGFFFSSEGKNYSSSLAVSEGTVLSVNINYAQMRSVNIDIVILRTPCLTAVNDDVALATRKLEEIGCACDSSSVCRSEIAVFI